MNLASTINMNLDTVTSGKIFFLDTHDFEKVVAVTEKKLKELKQPIKLKFEEACLSMRQYYALAVLNPDKKTHAISSTLDPYWHTHILDTKSYVKFCQELFGRYMHHVPLDKTNRSDVVSMKNLYVETRAEVEKLFGKKFSKKVFAKNPTSDILICNFDGFYD